MPSEKASSRGLMEAALESYYAVCAHIAETHAAKPKDPRLRLVYPLTSSRVLSCEVMDLGKTTETRVTVESVGLNGVKRVVDALVRATTTGRAVERILTIHTRLFGGRQHRVPAFKFLQTFIIDEITSIAEAGWCKGQLFLTIVDETGVYRSPVTRSKPSYDAPWSEKESPVGNSPEDLSRFLLDWRPSCSC